MAQKKQQPKRHIFMILCIIVVIIVIVIIIVNFSKKEKIEEGTNNNVINTGNGTSLDENTINVKEASLEKPAQIGDWIEVKLYGALVDEKTGKISNNYNDAFIRVNRMTRGTNELKPYIDRYNKTKINKAIDFNGIISSQEFALLEYEIYIPKDFKTNEDITNVNIKIKTVSKEGKEEIRDADAIYQSTYATLTRGEIKPNTIIPGNLIKCESIIMMSQYLNSKNYLFAIEYTLNGEKQYKYFNGNAEGKQRVPAAV
ncbi:MAG: hypothetical protein PHP54_01945 [Clostridia bacterium]|nr:hypothetical protein [Clostridia bacterium]